MISPRLCIASAVVFAVATSFVAWPRASADPVLDTSGQAAVPAVTVTSPRRDTLPLRIEASGVIAPWHEASVGTEADGLRLADVLVDVGDRVKRGDVMAVFAKDVVLAELAEAEAAVAEAAALLAEAEANAKRARRLDGSGALSRQQIDQLVALEGSARARLGAATASRQRQRLRLDRTRVHAPDDGIVSSRSATVGAVLPAGEELFRLIRGGRLEWRAEVTAAGMAGLAPGAVAHVVLDDGSTVDGTVRTIAPTLDASTLKGIVYVDLAPGRTRAGQFARGGIETAAVEAMTVPQRALVLREGFAHVLRIGADDRVSHVKVTPGRRAGDRIEIIDGLALEDRVVDRGAAFLGDGDRVRVVASPGAADATTPLE